MIPHNMTLFKFICVQYQFPRQTLPIMKIDRGQIQFRDYVSTGTEPEVYMDYPLTMVNMSAKFDQDARNHSVSIVFTRLFQYMSIVTFDRQNQ